MNPTFAISCLVLLSIVMITPTSDAAPSSGSYTGPRSLLASLLMDTFTGRSSNRPNSIRTPMQPVTASRPHPAVEYLGPVISLLKNIQDLEENFRKRTYSYALTVVGRPANELSLTQRLIRAALMPSSVITDSSKVFQRISNFSPSSVSDEEYKKNRFRTKNYTSMRGKQQALDMTDILIKVLSMAASAVPTKVVRS